MTITSKKDLIDKLKKLESYIVFRIWNIIDSLSIVHLIYTYRQHKKTDQPIKNPPQKKKSILKRSFSGKKKRQKIIKLEGTNMTCK